MPTFRRNSPEDGAKPQKNDIIILTAVKTSNLTYKIFTRMVIVRTSEMGGTELSFNKGQALLKFCYGTDV
jgi:hypothetical protein